MSSKLAKLINERAQNRGIAKKIASYLMDTKQTLQLDSLMRDVMSERESQGVFEVQVTSAHELTQGQVQEIERYVKNTFRHCKKVIIDSKIDPTLLGGLRIESANFLIDRTVKSKLNYLKTSIET